MLNNQFKRVKLLWRIKWLNAQDDNLYYNSCPYCFELIDANVYNEIDNQLVCDKCVTLAIRDMKKKQYTE